MPFTPAELEYLESQRLGRLATVDRDGAPQNNPVGFRVNEANGTVDIGGYRMPQTRKFRNVQHNARVALVVDDLVSVDPWTVRMVEIRGDAEAVTDADPPFEGLSRAVIRIHPRRVFAFGIDDSGGVSGRDF
jgi:pyridoxamine 5'-phosphate oxidase family protein